MMQKKIPDDMQHILCEDVRYRYPRSKGDVLQSVQLSVLKNEFVGITGRTGAGKTTLLSLVNGLIPHFFEGEITGRVIAGGIDTQQSEMIQLSKIVGMVFQDAETQILSTTVEKDVAFGPSNIGQTAEEMKKNIASALEHTGLRGYEKRSPTRLSGGEKQRVAVAGVLAMKPRILALDEPTSELDPEGSAQLFKMLERLCKDEGLTLLVASHESDRLLAHAKRIVVIDEGRICWDGEPRSLYSDVAACHQWGISVPVIAELMWRLQQKKILPDGPIPLTLQEAVPIMTELFSRYSKQTSSEKSDKLRTEDRKTIIEIRTLSHTYNGSREALQGINLQIGKGEFIALIGRNGAGKTTLAKHLNGLLKPADGKVLIDGNDTRQHSIGTLSRTVGYVFQNPDHQIFCPSVREEVEFGLRTIGGLSDAEISTRTAEALRIVGLEKEADRHPFTMGKGERQKLAVASVLARAPEVLVIDEPTTGLDMEGGRAMMEVIRKLHQTGHTIIVITHDMQLAADYAERVIVLSRGTILADGTPEDIFLQPELLLRAGLEAPPVAALSLALRANGIDLHSVSIKQFEENILNHYTAGVRNAR
jgi:energy-coupling factor transporter ATP-binding protein EcfA2